MTLLPGRLVDCKEGIIRGLAFFSCGCNQHKSFHYSIRVQSNKKKSASGNFTNKNIEIR
jgi:hypothetical protein